MELSIRSMHIKFAVLLSMKLIKAGLKSKEFLVQKFIWKRFNPCQPLQIRKPLVWPVKQWNRLPTHIYNASLDFAFESLVVCNSKLGI